MVEHFWVLSSFSVYTKTKLILDSIEVCRFKSTLKRNSIANLICFSIVLDVSNFKSLPKYSIARIVVDQTIFWNVLVLRSKLKLKSLLKIEAYFYFRTNPSFFEELVFDYFSIFFRSFFEQQLPVFPLYEYGLVSVWTVAAVFEENAN